MSDRIRKALRELVALEDLKKSFAQANHHAARFQTDANYAVIDELSTEIGRRRPLAWAEARAALDEGAGSSPPFVHPSALFEAAEDLLASIDAYPEQLVPINRLGVGVRNLRAAIAAQLVANEGQAEPTENG